MRNWDQIFSNWSSGPSSTEQTKIDNAVRQIRKAIKASDKLKDRDIDIFVQGSYKNRVNVSQDSDVDVAILCHNTFYWEVREDADKETVKSGIAPATYDYALFKREVFEALRDYFGINSVNRGNKSIDVNENTYRVDSDVVPFFDYRYYTTPTNYLKGVKLLPDNRIPSEILNWPTQHYDNGVRKNGRTGRRYKRVVRIMKKLRNEMVETNITQANNIPSFLIECLVYNTPDNDLQHSSYKDTIRAVLAHLFNNTRNSSYCGKWTEVSGRKYLFSGNQSWTINDVHNFIDAAWDYVGYE